MQSRHFTTQSTLTDLVWDVSMVTGVGMNVIKPQLSDSRTHCPLTHPVAASGEYCEMSTKEWEGQLGVTGGTKYRTTG